MHTTGSDWKEWVQLGPHWDLKDISVCALAGPVCGTLDASLKNVTLKSNEVTISFMSGLHRSGRGFLLSYATDQHPGRDSPTFVGIHIPHLKMYGWMCVCVCVFARCDGGRPRPSASPAWRSLVPSTILLSTANLLPSCLL